MALNGLQCADVALRNYTHSRISQVQGRTGPPGCLAKARWAGATVGRFDKNDNFKNL